MDTPETIEAEAPDRPARSFFSMRKLVVAMVVAAIFAIARSHLSPKEAMAAAGWMNNWDQAVEQCRATGKPALVLFTADWCPSCRHFESEVLSQDEVKSYLQEHYTLVMVDLTDRQGPNNERAKSCGVQAIPTLILYNESSQEVARDNEMSAPALVAWLKSGGRLRLAL